MSDKANGRKRPTAARRTRKPGSVVRIPLPDGSFGYGRVLIDPYVAFYEVHSERPLDDLDEIISSSVLFTLAVGHARPWEVIGERPLEERLQQPILMFWPKTSNPNLGRIIDEFGRETPATIDEAGNLEEYAVWSDIHIGRRLMAQFTDPSTSQNKSEVGESYRVPERHEYLSSAAGSSEWETGLLNNEEALDWVDRLLKTQGLDLIHSTLAKVANQGHEYLESDPAAEALADCEVAASLAGAWEEASDLPELRSWIEKHHLAITGELRDVALQALDRVMRSPSELLELWTDDEPIDNRWKQSVNQLRGRLVQIQV